MAKKVNVTPLHDRVIVKPAAAEEKTAGGIIIPDTAKEKPQKGVSHVLCSTQTKIAVFTFYPAQVNATQLTAQLSKSLGIPANRYLPSNEEIASGCPVLPNSTEKKLVQIAQSVFLIF